MDISNSGLDVNCVQWWQQSGDANLVFRNEPTGSSEQLFEYPESGSYRPVEDPYLSGRGIQYFAQTGEDVTLAKYVYVDYNPNYYYTENDILSIDDLTFSEDKDFNISTSTELNISEFFKLNTNLGYSINVYVKKDNESTSLIDNYKTYITENQDRSVNIGDSIGVGVGIKFYDESDVELYAPNLRDTHRLMAASELNHNEYYNVQLDIANTSIPNEAVSAQLVLFVYGMSAGSFIFKKPSVRNLSKFFYCIKDHKSTSYNSPNSKDGLEYWTQDFVWRPSYGAKSDFVAINEELKMGEGKDYVTNMAINALPMELTLNFRNRTDKEARAIIHFLQEKSFAYESIFSLDYKGDRLLSSEVSAFNFEFSYPYRSDLKYTCTQFNHTISYRNNNNINAKFICNTESSLSSVESHAGYNKRIDALIPIFIDETTHFKKGEQIKLNTFTLEEGDGVITIDTEKIKTIKRYPEDPLAPITGGIITFTDDVDVEEEDCVYITVADPKNSIFNVGKTKIKKKISKNQYAFWPILEEGDESDVANLRATSSAGKNTSVQWFDEVGENKLEPRQEELLTTDLADQLWRPTDVDRITPRNELFESEDGAQYFEETAEKFITIRGEDFLIGGNIMMKKMQVCPEDCMFSKVLLPEHVSNIPSEIIDPATGVARKRQVYLKNYRRMQIDSDIDAESLYVIFTPLENFTLEAKDDFWLLISAVQGRSSIYLKDPNEIPKYPWLEVRNFDHKPSLAFSLEQTPDNIQSSFINYYNKKFKRGINGNLSTFNLTFEQRSDEEASEILQFLESHLGYKKFRFQMPRPYLKDGSYITSPTRPYISTFYCPSWGHDIIYKNNHTISATFIESTTSIEEDLRNVFGIGRDEEKPCYGAEIYDPITTHELCTFSSQLMAAKGAGFDLNQDSKTAKSKAVDLIFIVDTTGSMTNQSMETNGVVKTKYQVCIDVVLKMITAHDGYIMPGTESYNGEFSAPPLSFGSRSGDDTVPPWPADDQVLNSLISKLYDPLKELQDELANNDYNLENLDRFKIKIDQKRVNLGFVLMADTRQVIQDISDYPNSFDKVQSYKSIDVKDTNDPLLEDSPRAISQALAQFYNSPRAEHVTDRIVIMLSDGVFTTADATMPLKGGSHDYNKFYSQYALDMCAQLRKGGDLAVRRPTDDILKKYGYKSQNPYAKMEGYKFKERDGGKSAYNNPDLGKDNPAWYAEEMPTVFMFARVGVPGQLSDYAPNYVYDYDKPAPYLEPPGKTPQFFFPITQEGDLNGEVTRMMDLIKVVEMLTNDNGYQNVLSIVLYNCGPHDVKLKNTLINIDGQNTALKYTTEILKEGIPKGGNARDLTFTQSDQGLGSIVKGYGGQYFGDPDNQDLFSDDPKASNILWTSFNTQYEVSRQGIIEDINGGWAANSNLTNGVKNTGVAFKGMPIRVFKADSGLEITDYNIGNVNADNGYKGDYSHLPVIKPGEKLDLFFGVKVNKLSDFSEKVQLFINSDDETIKEMDCYANYNFDIIIPSSKESFGDSGTKDNSDPTDCESVWMDSNLIIDHPEYGKVSFDSSPKLPIAPTYHPWALRDFADKPPTSGGNSFKMCNIASAQTYTFSQPIRNPLLAVYSLGRPNLSVTIKTSTKVIDYSGGAKSADYSTIVVDTDFSFKGPEAFGVLQFPGEHTSITLTPATAECYYSLVWGLQYCP